MDRKDGEKRALTPGLYLVATPIGNLGDITLRALDVLHAADVVACEDTRVTAKLLAAHGISTPMIPYHEHNAARVRGRLLQRLRRGETVALVSDAGMPLISDPGFKLAAACREAGFPVTVIPGPSAPLAALALSGLPTDRFLFQGFLPPRKGARRAALAPLAKVDSTLVLFESGNRLTAMLADAADILGPRPAALCREITKLHEEVIRGTLDALARRFATEGPPRGELVLVIAPPAGEPSAFDDGALDRALEAALGGRSLRDAVARVAAETGAPRRRVYARALALRRGQA